MNCPVCATTELKMTERQGVEIDYCPQCRGVWLDRGEMDKIIERSYTTAIPAVSQPIRSVSAEQRDRYDRDDEDYRREYGKPRKRKSFLDDLFDF